MNTMKVSFNKTCLSAVKIENFIRNFIDIFNSITQNLERVHTRTASPCPTYPSFTVGFKGLLFARACFPDGS